MFDKLYKPESFEWKNVVDKEEINNILNTYMEKYYDESFKTIIKITILIINY